MLLLYAAAGAAAHGRARRVPLARALLSEALFAPPAPPPAAAAAACPPNSLPRGSRWQQRRGAAFVPDAVKAAFEREGAPFAAALIPGAGRGLVAARAIEQGEVIWREAPLACVPSLQAREKVCYSCLSPVGPEAPRVPLDGARGAAAFCGPACLGAAERSFLRLETDPKAAAALGKLDGHCRRGGGERFPLIAARLALASLQRAAAGRGGGDGGGGCSPHSHPQQWQQQQQGGAAAGERQPAAAPLSSLQPPAAAAAPALGDLAFLCFANVPRPPPEDWQASFALLRAAVDAAAAAAAAGDCGDSGSGGSGGAAAGGAVKAAAAAIDLDWYVSVLSRLHLNSFRVDCVMLFDPSLGFAAAAAAALGGGSNSGSAVYLVASLFNHACEPTVDVTWPRNNAEASFIAARDISAGEELTITYTDSTQSVAARRAHLRAAYGFDCRCVLCQEQQGEGSG